MLDYSIAAFAVIIVISVFQWIVDGRKNFASPCVDLTIDALDTMSTGPTRNEHRRCNENLKDLELVKAEDRMTSCCSSNTHVDAFFSVCNTVPLLRTDKPKT